MQIQTIWIIIQPLLSGSDTGEKMRKRKIKFRQIIISILLIVFIGVNADAEGNTLHLEQAKVYMPDIKVFYYQENSGTEGITASLNDEKMQIVNTYSVSEDQTGTDYYILVDISKSIGKGYFSSIVEAIKNFPSGMGEQDTVTLVSFGNEVSILAEHAGKEEDIGSVVSQLDNNDDNTHLFEAFDRTEEIADREEYAKRRTITIVITDGEDCSTNESTKATALENLRKISMPVYAMAVKQTASGNENAFVEAFGDFVRETNGKLFLFGQEEAADVLSQIQNYVGSAQVLELKASSNKLVSVMQPLTVAVEGSGSEAIQICPRYSQKDEEAPTATAAQTGEKEITLTFSESVKNAGNTSSYQVQHDGVTVPIYVVTYGENDGYKAVLTMQEQLKSGEYTIAFQNITDQSMEENGIAEPVVFNLSPETEAETETKKTSSGGSRMAAAGVAAAVLAAVAVIIVVMRKKKTIKKKPEQEEESLLSQSVLHLDVRGEDSNRQIKAPIQEKLIIGRRSADCDIALQDEQLSRKHFTIEKDKGCFYIMDLDSTNGTILNGVEIHDRCKLKNGDVVQAGSLHITISW